MREPHVGRENPRKMTVNGKGRQAVSSAAWGVSHSLVGQWAGRNVKHVKVLRVRALRHWCYAVICSRETGLFLNCKNNQGQLNIKCLLTN